MKRYRDERPADICFARGTFNAHPYVMGAMQVFLERLETAPVQALYDGTGRTLGRARRALQRRAGRAGLPVRVAHLSSIWTVQYTEPSRYNWMLQFYLRERRPGAELGGHGRLIFSLTTATPTSTRCCAASWPPAVQMQADGWWWRAPALTNKAIRRGLLREALVARLG
jgi:glutamate-1-semialdehyde 2,1-aminomutase